MAHKGKSFNTRLALLYKSYAQWEEVKDTFIPLKGEVCICELPTNVESVVNAPTVLFKVGDGISTFGQLRFTGAMAADVHPWAKKETIEWEDLSEKFKKDLKDCIGARQYRILKDDTLSKWYLQSSFDGESSWTTVSTVNLTPLELRVASTEAIAIQNAQDIAKINNETIDSKIGEKISSLKHTDEEQDGFYVSKVSESDGIIEVDRHKLPEYNLVQESTTSEQYSAVYHLTKDGTNIGVPINIVKNQILKSATIETVVEDDVPYEGARVGDKYIDFVFNTSSGESHTYLPLNGIIVPYTSGDGIQISTDNVISVSQIPESKVTNLISDLNKKVPTTLVSDSGNAIIFNELDGGGAKFEHSDGTEAFVGVNNGGQNGLMAQIYADKYDGSKWQGSRISVYHDHIYYVSRQERAGGVANNDPEHEIATIKDIDSRKSMEIIDIASYGFNTNLRMPQQIYATQVVDDVIDLIENGGKSVVIAAGEYKMFVTEVVDNSEGGEATRGFTCVGSTFSNSGLTIESVAFVYTPENGMTKTYYTNAYVQAQSLINRLSEVAKTGNVNDLIQNEEDTLILKCELE